MRQRRLRIHGDAHDAARNVVLRCAERGAIGLDESTSQREFELLNGARCAAANRDDGSAVLYKLPDRRHAGGRDAALPMGVLVWDRLRCRATIARASG